MMLPLVFLSVSLAGLVASLVMPGWSDLLLLAGPSFLASLFIILTTRRDRPPRAGRPRRRRAQPIVVDGSNVMHWRDGTPQIATVREVADRLKSLGFKPGIVFDANAGYKLTGQYMGDAGFAKLLRIPRDRVLVVPKGTPADPTVLAAARSLGARIVSNDRFRDWSEDHPEIRQPGHLIPGGYRDGRLWLKVDGA